MWGWMKGFERGGWCVYIEYLCWSGGLFECGYAGGSLDVDLQMCYKWPLTASHGNAITRGRLLFVYASPEAIYVISHVVGLGETAGSQHQSQFGELSFQGCSIYMHDKTVGF